MFYLIIKSLTNNIYRLVVAILTNGGENTNGWPDRLID